MKTREFFHLAFLRALVRKIPESSFAVKGGSNLRFFFSSDRYSEDIDLDVHGVEVHVLKDAVSSILRSSGLRDTARSAGIETIRPPDLARAKQTQTVQRFKVHLLTLAGEDLATKIEFSRRGLDSPVRADPVRPEILAAHRMAPLIVPHYTAGAAVRQKIRALLGRRQPEARDVFDLFVLGAQPEARALSLGEFFSREELLSAIDRIDSLEHARYRDTVVGFLAPEDQDRYGSAETWDRIRLAVIEMLEGHAPGER
ncbi:MAG: nucleotidyl transferase AbiEii/AbiGii toxin family protein [Deltaproteobacteria bacterium]|nr:nucleotidyl transferase AbiEii/AbiGii toxin family protein [Deltaproteobacteria bacterium]